MDLSTIKKCHTVDYKICLHKGLSQQNSEK